MMNTLTSLVCGVAVFLGAVLYAAGQEQADQATGGAVAAAAQGAPSTVQEEPSAPAQLTAAALLERGFADFLAGKLAQASDDFSKATRTGELNDAGRVLAYWHVHIAERALGHEDLSAEALSSFIVVAEDLIRGQTASQSDFVERFDVRGRLEQARALLAATWAQRVPEFGRSAANPIRMHSPAEVTFFLHFASTCGDQNMNAERHSHVAVRVEGAEHVTIRCADDQPSREFFFSFH